MEDIRKIVSEIYPAFTIEDEAESQIKNILEDFRLGLYEVSSESTINFLKKNLIGNLQKHAIHQFTKQRSTNSMEDKNIDPRPYIMQYLISEIVEIAGRHTIEEHRKIIISEDIIKALKYNNELDALLKVTPNGYLPTIYGSTLPTIYGSTLPKSETNKSSVNIVTLSCDYVIYVGGYTARLAKKYKEFLDREMKLIDDSEETCNLVFIADDIWNMSNTVDPVIIYDKEKSKRIFEMIKETDQLATIRTEIKQGSICFEITNLNTAFEMARGLDRIGYCAMFRPIDNLYFLEKENLRVLVIEYDAESG
jgi:histone H3/H4